MARPAWRAATLRRHKQWSVPLAMATRAGCADLGPSGTTKGIRENLPCIQRLPQQPRRLNLRAGPCADCSQSCRVLRLVSSLNGQATGTNPPMQCRNLEMASATCCMDYRLCISCIQHYWHGILHNCRTMPVAVQGWHEPAKHSLPKDMYCTELQMNTGGNR